jgi:predicted ArsR family transcriptional regulator
MSTARARVLEALQSSAASVTAAQLAGSVGAHPNTVREHLDALVRDGLAVRSAGAAEGRGRPSARYSPSVAVREPDMRVREHAALALVLAEQIARSSADPDADASAAGQAWGRLVTAGAPGGTPRSARRRTLALLADLGFDPLTRSRADAAVLRRCPFLDIAQQQSPVVCSAHGAMIATVVEYFGGDGEQVTLHPFADPLGCVVAFGRGVEVA